jgi:hypothetical protein
MRRVRLKLAPLMHRCDLFDADTGYHFGQEVLINTENMLALITAGKKRPAEADLLCLSQPPRVGADGEIVTRKERVLVVDVTPY